jgi:hypothetical protein
MNIFLNENWRIFMEDVGKPAFVALGRIVNQILSNISKRFPYRELFNE